MELHPDHILWPVGVECLSLDERQVLFLKEHLQPNLS